MAKGRYMCVDGTTSHEVFVSRASALDFTGRGRGSSLEWCYCMKRSILTCVPIRAQE
jgi:hypothetical protein